VKKPTAELFEDFENIKEKYMNVMKSHELAYLLIQLSVKMLMDIAPRHKIALETIRVATEEGIKWHVEERTKQKRGPNHAN